MDARTTALPTMPIPERERVAAIKELTTAHGWHDWLVMRKHFRTLSVGQQLWVAWNNAHACEDATELMGMHDTEDDTLAPLLELAVGLAEDLGWTVVFEPIRSNALKDCMFEFKTLTVHEDAPANRKLMAVVETLSILLLQRDPAYRCLALGYDEESVAIDSVAYVVLASIGVTTLADPRPAPTWSPKRTAPAIAQVASLVDRIAKRIERRVLG